MIHIDVRKNLSTAEGPVEARFKLEIPPGEFVVLMGPSGAGKTTLLRMLAGLTDPDAGRVEVAGEVWFDSGKKINLPSRKRSIGFVFQDYALFPNMSVIENLRFAGKEKRETERYADEILSMMKLTQLRDRYPDTLSGGQKQRVALARALVRKPSLLLLDEPLSALDPEMRINLQDELIRIHRELALTILLVSHEIAEIYKLASRSYLIEKGEVVKAGTPHQVFGENKFSGKFRFMGTVLEVEKSDVVYIVTILIGNDPVKVIAAFDEAKDLRPGESVIVASKAFQPMLLPVRSVSSNRGKGEGV